jgi:hypothetical protein
LRVNKYKYYMGFFGHNSMGQLLMSWEDDLPLKSLNRSLQFVILILLKLDLEISKNVFEF